MRDFLDWFGNTQWVVKIPLILVASMIILGALGFGASLLSGLGSEQNTGYNVEYNVKRAGPISWKPAYPGDGNPLPALRPERLYTYRRKLGIPV